VKEKIKQSETSAAQFDHRLLQPSDVFFAVRLLKRMEFQHEAAASARIPVENMFEGKTQPV
jgi:hypothetical protein